MTIRETYGTQTMQGYTIENVPADYDENNAVKDFHIFAPFGYDLTRAGDTIRITAYID